MRTRLNCQIYTLFHKSGELARYCTVYRVW